MKPVFIESICCEGRQLQRTALHQERAARTVQAVWGCPPQFDFSHISLPADTGPGRYKCRVAYQEEIVSLSFTPYAIRPVRSLKAVEAPPTLDYTFKSADRSALEALFGKRGGKDDILITRNGYLTDTYYANIALWDGRAWYTPDKPLLAGTRRASLLASGQIIAAPLHIKDLQAFTQVALFNAMMGLGEGPVVATTAIEHSFTKK